MSTNVQIEVTGVKEALRELNSIDKQARRDVTRRFKEIMRPSVQTAQNLTPIEPPMSGWARTWRPSGGQPVLPWGGSSDRRQIVPFVSGKRPSEFAGRVRNLAAFGFQWKAADAVLFDASSDPKTRAGRQMILEAERPMIYSGGWKQFS